MASFVIDVNSKFAGVDTSLTVLKSHDTFPHLHVLAAGVDLPIGGIGRADAAGNPESKVSFLTTLQFLDSLCYFSRQQFHLMDRQSSGERAYLAYFLAFLRKCIYMILSRGPIPNHIAFIMDGNRRFSKKNNMIEGAGHRVGFSALMLMLKYCYEFRVKYVTIYAFSIDNFKRSPEEVESVMELMREKIDGLIEEKSIINEYGVRVRFVGNLKLLSKPVRLAAERAMASTAENSKAVLSICIAYTSTDEILHAVQESCEEKRDEINALEASGSGYGLVGLNDNEKEHEERFINVKDIEKHMYVTPDPDIIIRTSGETRLSNFLLWQSSNSLLYSPIVLWPEIQFWHLVWAVLEFQRKYMYLKGKRKQQ